MTKEKKPWEFNPAKSYTKVEQSEHRKKENDLKPGSYTEKQRTEYETLSIEGLALGAGKRFLWGVMKSCQIIGFLIVILASAIGMLSYEGIRWALKTWSNLKIDEIIYQLKVPITGTNEDLISEFISTCISPAVTVLIIVLVIAIGFRKKVALRRVVLTGVFGISVWACVSSVQLAWDELDLKDYVANQSENSTFIQDNYVDPRSVEITFPEQKRNLIYIYLESMENTYMSKDAGGGFEVNYIPELMELQNNNLYFSNTEVHGGGHATVGATWTMGGMFAQTSGLPLLLPINDNDMSAQDDFLPDIMALGDILDEQGYTQELMGGANADFAGKGMYFEEHGNYKVWDLNTPKELGLLPEDYYKFWGYEDEKLFAYAKDQLTEISQSGQPFNLTMLTLDTHFEDGYTCELCRDDFEGDKYGNAIACSSRQVASFVQWIQEQEFYENTTIILSGDHLTMDSDFCDSVDSNYDRTVYSCIINSPTAAEATQNRKYVTMDMFPTTLASIGATIEGERIGLGTNLFSGQQTLTEQYGLDYIDGELSKNSTFFNNFTKDIVVENAESE